MIVAQQTNENQRTQQVVRQQRRVQRRSDQQNSNNSTKKTLELLEYVMPQNRRIYHFGVKTLQPRPIGKNSLSFFLWKTLRQGSSRKSHFSLGFCVSTFYLVEFEAFFVKSNQFTIIRLVLQKHQRINTYDPVAFFSEND